MLPISRNSTWRIVANDSSESGDDNIEFLPLQRVRIYDLAPWKGRKAKVLGPKV